MKTLKATFAHTLQDTANPRAEEQHMVDLIWQISKRLRDIDKLIAVYCQHLNENPLETKIYAPALQNCQEIKTEQQAQLHNLCQTYATHFAPAA